MDDDFFDDTFDDAALAAALDAAERSKSKPAPVAPPSARPQATGARNVPTPVLIRNDQSRGSSSSTTATTTPGGGVKQPAPTAVKQPEPRKIAKPIGFSAIIVSTRQKGNPILSHIKQVPWEYGDIVPDYVMGPSTCALFLSLKYHRLHPEYIYNRIKALGHSYSLRVLLIFCDTDQHADPIAELTKTAFAHKLTVIVSWSATEAGGYIEAYKRLEHAPPTQIKERAKTEWMDQVVEFTTVVPGVNKTDAYGLISMFGTVKDAINATPEQLTMIPGWGQKKVDRWTKAMKEPLNPRKEEDEERREQLQRFARAGGGTGVGRNKEDDNQAIINARLGIASVRLGKKAEERIREDAEIDEDVLMAAAEAEAAEEELRRRNTSTTAAAVAPSSGSSGPASSATATAATATSSASTTTSGVAPASSGTTEGVMAALAKLRQS